MKKNDVYVWNNNVRCVVSRVSEKHGWVDFNVERSDGRGGWSKRMSLPLPPEFRQASLFGMDLYSDAKEIVTIMTDGNIARVIKANEL